MPNNRRFSGGGKVFKPWFAKCRKGLMFFSLFYMTLYLPLAGVFYFPHWHLLYSGFNQRCEKIGYEIAYQGIKEMNAFWWHQGELKMRYWSDKEKQHLAEVRRKMNHMMLIFFLSATILMLTFDQRQIQRFSGINAILIVSLLVVLPFFAFFWQHIFHPLLFSNRLWLNTPNDFSYWIMPRKYFKYTVALLILSSCLLNLAIFFISRKLSKQNPKNQNI